MAARDCWLIQSSADTMSIAKVPILGAVVALMIVGVQPPLLANQDPWRKVVALADEIKVARPSPERGEMARKLELLIDRMRRREAPKELVDKLIDLMSDE